MTPAETAAWDAEIDAREVRNVTLDALLTVVAAGEFVRAMNAPQHREPVRPRLVRRQPAPRHRAEVTA